MQIRLRVGGSLGVPEAAALAQAIEATGGADGVAARFRAAAGGGVAFGWSGLGCQASCQSILDALGMSETAAWRLEIGGPTDAGGSLRVLSRRSDLGWPETLEWIERPDAPAAVPLERIVGSLEAEEAPLGRLLLLLDRTLGQSGRPELPALTLAAGPG